MKKFIVLISIISFLLSCSHRNSISFSSKNLIQPNSFKAHLLSLSAEDIQILSLHVPKTLGKINKGFSISLEELVKLHEIGLSSESLLLIIKHTKSRFNLTTSDVIRLQMEGLPFKVINYLINT